MRSTMAMLLGLLVASAAPARAAEPITIGFAEALTGGLAVVGKSGVLAAQIWADEVNAKGGLLGRPVKLVFYDNQSNAANVPGIYTKLLDVDHVDLIVSGYSTNMTAPAMPVAIAHNKLFVSLFCLAVNSEFHYPRYFSMLPTGPDPKHAFSQRLLRSGGGAEPEAADGRHRGRRCGVRHATPRTARATTPRRSGCGSSTTAPIRRPPTDYTPVVRAVRATNPDVIYVASYPPDTAGILRAANEIGLKAMLFGGRHGRLQTTALKTQLGPLLNGIVVNENWLPAPTMQFPGVMDFLKRYQAKAPAKASIRSAISCRRGRMHGCSCWRRRSRRTQSIDDGKLADYFRSHTFKTIIGDVTFGKDGEWAAPRVVWTQFQNIKGNDLEQFKDPATEVVRAAGRIEVGNADLAVFGGHAITTPRLATPIRDAYRIRGTTRQRRPADDSPALLGVFPALSV